MKLITITEIVSDVTFTILQDQVTKLEGWEYPEVRNVVEDISGKKSSLYITSKFGRRRFSLTGFVRNQGYDDRRTMIQALRQTGYQKLLKFTTLDNLTLQASVEILKVVHPYTAVKQPFFIDMVAADSKFYSQTEHVNNSASYTQTINNAGNGESCPIFKIYGPFATATIVNLANSQQFIITSSVADAHYIEIDVLNRTAKLDGITSMFSAFDGEFFGLEPGDNILQFSYTTGGGNTNLITLWRDSYGGL